MAIGYPRVCLTVSSDGTDRVVKRVIFYLPDSSEAFLSEILVSLSLSISRDQTQTKPRLAGVDSGRKEMGWMLIKYL